MRPSQVRLLLLPPATMPMKLSKTIARQTMLIKILFHVLLSLASFVAAQDGGTWRPPFPRLQREHNRLHIVAGRYDSKDGHSSQEEFVDFQLGRGAFIERTASGHRTILSDARSQSTAVYWPYSCQVREYPEMPACLSLRADQSPRLGDFSVRPGLNKEGNIRWWYLFGVAAMWNEASWLHKIYRPVSAASDSDRERRHRWRVEDHGVQLDFYFREIPGGQGGLNETTSSQPELSLTAISLSSSSRRATIDVHLIEFELADDVYHNQLQLPLMYGCQRPRRGGQDDESLEIAAQVGQSMEKYHLKLEVTAARFQGANQEKQADTMSLEFGRTRPSDENLSELWPTLAAAPMRMIHQIGSRTDLKTVLDRKLNVKYQVDRRAGTCKMTNLGSLSWSQANHDNDEDDEDGDGDHKEDPAKLSVEFSNGLKWEFSDRMMDFLFYSLDGLELIKLTGDERRRVAHFAGSERLNLAAADADGRRQVARLVRRYSLWPDSRAELDSATVWILDPELGDLREVYEFTVLESGRELLSAPQEAQMFDVSQECYLDNEPAMKYGRDFVWLRLHYPVADAGQLQLLPELRAGLEREFYHSLRSQTNISHFRLPKMEFMFSEDNDQAEGFTLRMLLLDSAPLHLIYDHVEGFFIEPEEGDQVEIAADQEHCSRLCRLNRCEAMSFCRGQFSCVLTRSQTKLGAKMRDAQSGDCCTFRKPAKLDEDQYYDGKLSNVLARLKRHANTDWSLQVPPMPEELLNGRPDAGTALGDLKLRVEHAEAVQEFLDRTGLRGFSVVRHLWGLMLVLVPDRVEVEPDLKGRPTRLGGGSAAEDEPPTVAFHRGLLEHRYELGSFGEDRGVAGREARRFVGIDYGQCALACVEASCSSFSFCRRRQECIITDLYDIGPAAAGKHTRPDADCAIVQRDFLAKFNKFPGVGQAATSLSRKAALNPAECAHSCVIESDFNCLAFTFCPDAGATKGSGGSCQYSDSRTIEAGQLEEANREPQCDHYTRSQLADFARFEFSQIERTTLGRLTNKSTFEARNLDECAQICALELLDCAAFQFCHDEQSGQQCIMIGGADTQLAAKRPGVAATGLLLSHNQSCHVFTLRADSSEAKIRQLLPLAEPESTMKTDTQSLETAAAGSRLLTSSKGRSASWLALLVMLVFCCSSLVFSTLGLLLMVALRAKPGLRSRVDRIRAIFGRYE